MAYVEVDEPIVLDSTGQDIKDELTAIKSAVQGLGTALGSDRALINGSNIADKGTFREAIGMQFTPTTAVTSTSLSGYSSYADLVIAEDGCYSFKTYTYASSPVNLVLSFANGNSDELWGYVQINAPQYTTIHSPILWLKKGTYKLRATGDHVNMYKYS